MTETNTHTEAETLTADSALSRLKSLTLSDNLLDQFQENCLNGVTAVRLETEDNSYDIIWFDGGATFVSCNKDADNQYKKLLNVYRKFEHGNLIHDGETVVPFMVNEISSRVYYTEYRHTPYVPIKVEEWQSTPMTLLSEFEESLKALSQQSELESLEPMKSPKFHSGVPHS